MAELDLRSLDEALPVLLPECDLSKRSVGVVERDDGRIQPGYTLISAGRETYLLDEDGRVVHEWRSSRQVFVSYLLPNGNLLRDGSDNDEADLFRLGGAAGFVEEVTWDNERVWSFSKFPMNTFLTHHDLEPMPNGNVLVMCWNRGRRVDGRRKELMPDGEVWDNVVIELKPDGRGGAEAVWSWSFFDHLVQEVNTHCDFTCARGSPKDYPERMDINFCPAGGKHGTRNKNVLLSDREKRSRDMRHTAGRTAYEDTPGKTGEKDWLHCNSVSYCPKRDHVLISINVLCEIIVVKRGVTKEDGTQDLHQRQTGILWRWGNPTSYQCGTRMDQKLFAQHYANFIGGAQLRPAPSVPNPLPALAVTHAPLLQRRGCLGPETCSCSTTAGRPTGCGPPSTRLPPRRPHPSKGSTIGLLARPLVQRSHAGASARGLGAGIASSARTSRRHTGCPTATPSSARAPKASYLR